MQRTGAISLVASSRNEDYKPEYKCEESRSYAEEAKDESCEHIACLGAARWQASGVNDLPDTAAVGFPIWLGIMRLRFLWCKVSSRLI